MHVPLIQIIKRAIFTLMEFLKILYGWLEAYKDTVRAITWFLSFAIGLLFFVPLYESTYAEALRSAYGKYPVLKEVFSVEEILLSAVVLSGVVAMWGFAILFAVYYFIPGKTSSINQVVHELSFVFEGPSKILLVSGFLLLGVAGSGFMHDELVAGTRIGILSLLVCFLPAAYFKWQSKATIKDRPWLRDNAIWLAVICGLLGGIGVVYTFVEKWLALTKVVWAVA